MAQQSLIYSFVARGTVILVEFTDFKGNFTSIAAQCLQKLPSSNNKFTYNCDGHTFNYLVENGFTYCVVAVDSAGRQIPMAFLERVKEDFNKRYGGGKAATAQANSLNKEFGSKLKEHMQYCMDHPDEISKLAKSSAHIDWKNPRSQTPPKLAPDPASQTASPERDDAHGSPWNPTHIGDSSTTHNDGHGAGAPSTSSESSGSITRHASIDSFDSRCFWNRENRF